MLLVGATQLASRFGVKTSGGSRGAARPLAATQKMAPRAVLDLKKMQLSA